MPFASQNVGPVGTVRTWMPPHLRGPARASTMGLAYAAPRSVTTSAGGDVWRRGSDASAHGRLKHPDDEGRRLRPSRFASTQRLRTVTDLNIPGLAAGSKRSSATDPSVEVLDSPTKKVPPRPIDALEKLPLEGDHNMEDPRGPHPRMVRELPSRPWFSDTAYSGMVKHEKSHFKPGTLVLTLHYEGKSTPLLVDHLLTFLQRIASKTPRTSSTILPRRKVYQPQVIWRAGFVQNSQAATTYTSRRAR